ncbi:MAG: OmpA family protein [Rhodobiaceae bacterium]|jgi:chemotaxis protein MotB|nr:OmpA family protein [Cryomorphaceae bacterium]MBT5640215.1 OmpA family protein [Rhodobiaceae bacterium]
MPRILLIILSIFLISSCITPKVYNELLDKHEIAKKNLTKNEKLILELRENLDDKERDITNLNALVEQLRKDSIALNNDLVACQKKYDDLSTTYDLLTSKSSRYMAEKAKETKELLNQLETTQSELFAKEDQLNKSTLELEEKERKLLDSQNELELRSLRVAELEAIINRKDSMVTALKQKISKALIGLEGDGLTIEQRNGKVYISLEEDLLFASGKYEINQTGKQALDKLSDALSYQKDLEILVEGHTDSIPLSGRGLVKDNWDLSVMRATSVVKRLTSNTNLDPTQLIAAGRSEFVPISSNETSEGRGENRRIEMILSPNLDDLFKLLEE